MKKYKKIPFGFTGDSQFFINKAIVVSRGVYTFAEYLGALIITGVATTIKSPSYYSWDFSNHSIIELVCSPYFWGAIGISLVWFGRSNKSQDFENLTISNENIKLSFEELQNDYAIKGDEAKKILEIEQKKVRKLTEDLTKAKQEHSKLYSNFLQNWLKATMIAMKIDNSKFRVTIFVYSNGSFFYLSRYSANPLFDDMHSISFEKNKGVISQAWEHGECIDIVACPIYDQNPDKYLQYMKDKYGFDEEKARRLTMKSCQYIAFAIKDQIQPLGVIVFETIDSKRPITTQKVGVIRDYCAKHQVHLTSYVKEGIRCDTIGMMKAKGDLDSVDIEEEILKEINGVGAAHE